MVIRRAQSRDIPGIISLLYQVGQIHHEIRPDIFYGGVCKYTPEQLEALLRDDSKPIFVAELDGAVAGHCFCQIRVFEDRDVQMHRKDFYIDDLCVDESCRTHHIGSALCDYATDYAKQLGCDFLTLNVWCGNDTALRFYENKGLTPRNMTMEKKLC